MDAKQAMVVLAGLAAATADPITHPAGWKELVSLAAQYTRQQGVSRNVIDQARTMTVEQLFLTALGNGKP